jgi:hypothetical protein
MTCRLGRPVDFAPCTGRAMLCMDPYDWCCPPFVGAAAIRAAPVQGGCGRGRRSVSADAAHHRRERGGGHHVNRTLQSRTRCVLAWCVVCVQQLGAHRSKPLGTHTPPHDSGRALLWRGVGDLGLPPPALPLWTFASSGRQSAHVARPRAGGAGNNHGSSTATGVLPAVVHSGTSNYQSLTSSSNCVSSLRGVTCVC